MRLADWQINQVNIVVKCPNRFLIPKLDLEDIKFKDWESVKAFHNNVYLSLPASLQVSPSLYALPRGKLQSAAPIFFP